MIIFSISVANYTFNFYLSVLKLFGQKQELKFNYDFSILMRPQLPWINQFHNIKINNKIHFKVYTVLISHISHKRVGDE